MLLGGVLLVLVVLLELLLLVGLGLASRWLIHSGGPGELSACGVVVGKGGVVGSRRWWCLGRTGDVVAFGRDMKEMKVVVDAVNVGCV